MLKTVKCQLPTGEIYNRYINGKLADPKQTIDIVDVKPIEGCKDLVSVLPAQDTEVRFTDAHGGEHVDRITRGSAFVVNPKFVVDR